MILQRLWWTNYESPPVRSNPRHHIQVHTHALHVHHFFVTFVYRKIENLFKMDKSQFLVNCLDIISLSGDFQKRNHLEGFAVADANHLTYVGITKISRAILYKFSKPANSGCT